MDSKIYQVPDRTAVISQYLEFTVFNQFQQPAGETAGVHPINKDTHLLFKLGLALIKVCVPLPCHLFVTVACRDCRIQSQAIGDGVRQFSSTVDKQHFSVSVGHVYESRLYIDIVHDC